MLHCFLSVRAIQGTTFLRAKPSGTDLGAADVGGTNLPGARLRRTEPTGANLRGADLHRANPVNVNLARASVADEQLNQTASLRGAALPIQPERS
jgi:uncharacterized protein YjbI with pentapeptide repeats